MPKQIGQTDLKERSGICRKLDGKPGHSAEAIASASASQEHAAASWRTFRPLFSVPGSWPSRRSQVPKHFETSCTCFVVGYDF